MFGRMIARGYDILALDEPTNNLDVESREAIERCLESWAGTVVIVSHDRYLLDRICTTTLSIEDETVHTYFGPPSARMATPAKGADNTVGTVHAMDSVDVLVLQNRLAVLSAKLSDASAGEAERADAERDFSGDLAGAFADAAQVDEQRTRPCAPRSPARRPRRVHQEL